MKGSNITTLLLFLGKKVLIIESLTFNNTEEFIENICNDLVDSDSETFSVSIYTHYDIAKEILYEAIQSGFKPTSIHLVPAYDPGDYDKEYIITITEDKVWCEKAWHEDNEYHPAGYLGTYDDVIYVHSDCNSKILSQIKGNHTYEFSIGEDVDECNSLDHENDVHGFTVSLNTENNYSSYSFHSTDKDLVNEMAMLFNN